MTAQEAIFHLNSMRNTEGFPYRRNNDFMTALDMAILALKQQVQESDVQGNMVRIEFDNGEKKTGFYTNELYIQEMWDECRVFLVHQDGVYQLMQAEGIWVASLCLRLQKCATGADTIFWMRAKEVCDLVEGNYE